MRTIFNKESVMRRRRCGKKERWMADFRGCGYRMTAGREAVMEALMSTKEHLSAEEIFFIVKKNNPNAGLTTVYRTLEMLVQMGTVYK
ncbi:MAG TPA: hypothetical protein ENN55_06045, partial [Firmicutes bacterium]|nr:hypothetical protein [Bacillota bacterium]